MRLILAEKASVGHDIAEALGIRTKHRTHIEIEGGVVTWTVGHLFELASPEVYDEKWSKWRFNTLPINPDRFRLELKSSVKAQYKVVKELLTQATEVVIATDTDREGESIAREVLEHVRYKGPMKRLWLVAFNKQSVLEGFRNLREPETTFGLYRAAQARQRADWLVGMNLTRAVTLSFAGAKEVLNIGRVQTPTFALVVRRDREIANFKPRDYYDLSIVAKGEAASVTLTYQPKEENRIWETTAAQGILRTIQGSERVLSVVKERKAKQPPKLFDLSGIQKVANTKWGWSAIKTLNIMQSLYETHKATTYPRTDSTYLPETLIADVPATLAHIAHNFGLEIPENPLIRKTVFDSSKVEIHFAIIPTTQQTDLGALSSDEMKVYELVVRQYLAQFYPDYIADTTVMSVEAEGLKFSTNGSIPFDEGWREVLGKGDSKTVELPAMKNGERVIVQSGEVLSKKTKAPDPYTYATLLGDMENVSKYVSDPELKKILKEDEGIGTPATRAAILAGLVDHEFVAEAGKIIKSTQKANRLYDILDKNLPALLDPAVSAIWERDISEIEKGKRTVELFVSSVNETIGKYLKILGGFEKQKSMKDESEYESFHPDHKGEKVKEDEKAWYCPAYGRLPKTIASRPMRFEEIKAIIEDGSVDNLSGFVSSKTGKTFSAGLMYGGQDEVYGSAKFEFVFPERTGGSGKNSGQSGTDTGVITVYGKLFDHGEGFRAAKVKGTIWKSIGGRVFTAEEIGRIIDSKDGVMFEFVSKRTGSTYKATVKFDADAIPFPKMEMIFGNKK